jgi:hypothetical protein
MYEYAGKGQMSARLGHLTETLFFVFYLGNGIQKIRSDGEQANKNYDRKNVSLLNARARVPLPYFHRVK